MPDAVAFWSYAHEDDELAQGDVVALGRRLKAEYELQTGESLELFLDRDSIEWGNEWKGRIETALVQTTFFIALISQRYFTRPECRNELETFAAVAQGLGVEKLILPVLYASVPDLTPDNPDGAIALVGGLQYEDWTSLRLEDPHGPIVKKAIHKLAQRLSAVAVEVGTAQLHEELEAAAGSGDPGLVDLMAEIDRLLPDWLVAVETDPLLLAQFEATQDAFRAKREKLGRAVDRKKRSVLLLREAAEFMPLEQRHLELAEVYVKRTVELDSKVSRAIRIVGEHAESRPMLRELEASVAEAMDNITNKRRSGKSVANWARQNAHLSRLMRELAQTSERSFRLIRDGNAIVERWQAELADLEANAENPLPPVA
jgi:flagellar biosynthesis chaperone FliJ